MNFSPDQEKSHSPSLWLPIFFSCVLGEEQPMKAQVGQVYPNFTISCVRDM